MPISHVRLQFFSITLDQSLFSFYFLFLFPFPCTCHLTCFFSIIPSRYIGEHDCKLSHVVQVNNNNHSRQQQIDRWNEEKKWKYPQPLPRVFFSESSNLTNQSERIKLGINCNIFHSFFLFHFILLPSLSQWLAIVCTMNTFQIDQGKKTHATTSY